MCRSSGEQGAEGPSAVNPSLTAEDIARLGHAFFEAQVNSSLDGILVVDSHGKKILQNEMMGRLWKIPPEIVNDPDDSLQLNFVAGRVLDRKTFVERVKHLNSNPAETDRTYIELNDGTILDRYSSPVVGKSGEYFGRIWTFRDVTDVMRSDQALTASEEKLRMLAASIPQLVFECETDGWNVYFNEQWVRYTGLSAEESHGHGWTKAFHPDDQGAGSHTTEESGAYELESRLRRADGVYRWFLIRGQPIRDASNQVVRWFGTCTDIHDLKVAKEQLVRAQEELEARVEQRTEELSAATQEAERANRAKSEFLSRMSHELRTPLNAILGFAQVMEMDLKRDSRERDSLQHILKGGRHLLGLINEVLDLASVESGRLDYSIEPVPVWTLISESCDLIRPLASQRGVTLVVEDRTHIHAMADNQRLKQVLLNLLSNGIKYNRQGGKLTISTASAPGGRIRISVRDTGFGLSEDQIQKLYTPFERLGAGNTTIEGSGLGLALSRRLVSAMNGNLLVESVVGEGCTFHVDLAEADCASNVTCMPEGDYPSIQAETEESLTVLAIEDNPSNLLLLQKIFATRPSVTLLPAVQGSIGLELAKQHLPDLVLLDLNLPDISGSEVLSALRQFPSTANIPVIIVSADVTPRQVERLLSAGAAAYLTKPLDIAEFLRVFDDTIEVSARRQPGMAS
jgi:PAS domain S-box-containing protein